MFKPDYSVLKGKKVGVGYSGGVDSSVLLCDLVKNAERLGIEVVAINVEHGIRGESSLSDSEFCKREAEKLGVKIKNYSVAVPSFAAENGYSIEQAARILRYECFFDALKNGVCDVVALAHHASDNAETVLFNLLRGSSLTGVAGMSLSDYGGKIVRPFLNLFKDDLTEYALKNGVPFVEDESNADEEYTRNALRREVIPTIKKKFPKAEQSLCRFALSAAADDEYLYSLARKELSEKDGELSFSATLAYSVFSRCVILALKAKGVEKDYVKANVDDVFSLRDKQEGRTIELAKRILASREGERIVIYKKEELKAEALPFRIGRTELCGYTVTAEIISSSEVDEAALKSRECLYFDYDKLPEDAVLRLKEDGDEFVKFNGQRVGLKKYLTDLKTGKRKKARTVVIAKGKTVYCVPEKDISGLIKIDKNSKNIIKLSCASALTESN